MDQQEMLLSGTSRIGSIDALCSEFAVEATLGSGLDEEVGAASAGWGFDEDYNCS